MNTAGLLRLPFLRARAYARGTWSDLGVLAVAFGLGCLLWVLDARFEARTLRRALEPEREPPSMAHLVFRPEPEVLLVRCLLLGSCLLVGVAAVRWLERSRQYHRDLRQGEDRLALALDQANLAIWEYHPRDGRTIARARCEHLFGLPEDPSGQTARTLSSQADHQDYAKACAMVDACIHGREHPAYCDYRIIRPDGAARWIRDRCLVLERDAAGEALRVLRTFQDVTEERRAEDERLRLTAAAEHSQRIDSLGMLAGQIAHDFRNYLAAIIGSAEAVAAEAPPDSATAKAIDGIRRTVARASDLCRQLLSYSGAAGSDARPVNVGEALAGVRSMLDMAVGRAASLEIQAASDLWVAIDPTQFNQIVLNLAINAAEAMNGGGTGTITLRAAGCEWRDGLGAGFVLGERLQPAPYCLLQVRDQGCGMPPEDAARIFEPFFSTKAQGRGLGMAAVFGIVRRHHGALRVATEPGRGTCVSILLPRVRPPAQPPASV